MRLFLFLVILWCMHESKDAHSMRKRKQDECIRHQNAVDKSVYS